MTREAEIDPVGRRGGRSGRSSAAAQSTAAQSTAAHDNSHDDCVAGDSHVDQAASKFDVQVREEMSGKVLSSTASA